jgi:hypothetical protein
VAGLAVSLALLDMVEPVAVEPVDLEQEPR